MRLFLCMLTVFGLPVLAAAEPAPRLLSQASDAAAVGTDRTAAPSRRPPAARGFRPILKTGVDDVLVELGAFGHAPEADAAAALRASPYVLWQPQREWEFRAGFRVDGWLERGGAAALDDWRADFGDTYARWRSGDTRLTFGAQTIVWGRVDEIAPSDRVSRVDLGRFILDDLAERRLPQLALRWEQTLGDFKLDAVALPVFRGARLPDVGSLWSPVNQTTGEVIGIPPSPALAALVSAASVREDHDGSGGVALRLTRSGAPPFDFGLTMARTRQTLPYYSADPAGPTLTAVYPYTTFAGADIEFATGSLTWRSEIGFTDGVPATRPGGQTIYTNALDWVGALEFFPGAGDTRVSLQLAARSLRTSETVLELNEYYSVNGEVETTLDQGRWKLGARFFSGLNVRDGYVAPRISFLGWEPHELYVVGRFFDGESRTLGGFHRHHDMLAFGLKTKF